ncbi:MAG: DUF4245 domain-containing protein [Pseudonocardia sp.]|nr:DUF4245 domain-containing protein [Pseudonocardia sp.]
MSSPSEPPPQKPARGGVPDVRGMLLALGVLIVIALVGVGGLRSCTFAPGGPQVDPDAVPVTDVGAAFAEFAKSSAFPLRVPAVPEGWRANSTDRGAVPGGGSAVRAGYVTPDGRYLRLVQSDAAEADLLAAEAGGPQQGRGTVEAAGLTWVEYGAPDREPFRIATLPGTPVVRLLITGSGADAEFRALADAAVRAPLLPGPG